MTFNNKIGKVEIAVFMCLVFLIAGELYIVLWTAVINSSNVCVCANPVFVVRDRILVVCREAAATSTNCCSMHGFCLTNRDAMHKRGLCRHAVSVRPYVCLSKRVNISSKFFHHRATHTILVFPYQTLWQYSDGHPLTRASDACGVGKIRDSGFIAL